MDKITRFGGTPFSITVRINNKTLTFNLLDSHKVKANFFQIFQITICMLVRGIVVTPVFYHVLPYSLSRDTFIFVLVLSRVS